MSLGIIFLLSICTIATAQGSDNILAVPVANRAAGFQGNGNFNALVFGNLTANAGDVEGRLALSGNFDFNSAGNAFSVGINTPGVGSP
ncbi:MAG: collagen-binding domain-containing protein [Ferruginibacter sp.]